jgi:tetratricopeptide (TPR) repeat protein
VLASPRPAAGITTAGNAAAGSTTAANGPGLALGGPGAEPKTQSRPEPARPTPPKTPEPRAIEQPDLYQPEKLDKLQTHERLNLGNVSLSEAIQLADSQPDKAIHGFRQALKADPTNVNAHAWLAVVLYDQGRTAEFVQELREARRQGILGQMAARNLRFKSALSQARFGRKLPSDLLD